MMVTAPIAPSRLPRRLLPMLAAAMLAFLLLAGAGPTTRVGAKPVGPGVDGVSVACRSLQDQVYGLIAQYSDLGSVSPTSPQLNVLLDQINQIGLTWRQIGCQAAFGNITGSGIVHWSPPSATQFPILGGTEAR